MLYAREVIDLLGRNPDRPFRMIEIVRHIADGSPQCRQERDRYRKGVLRVLDTLSQCQSINVQRAGRGQTALYQWKVGHRILEKWDA